VIDSCKGSMRDAVDARVGECHVGPRGLDGEVMTGLQASRPGGTARLYFTRWTSPTMAE
jgi:hypothetical protein